MIGVKTGFGRAHVLHHTPYLQLVVLLALVVDVGQRIVLLLLQPEGAVSMRILKGVFFWALLTEKLKRIVPDLSEIIRHFSSSAETVSSSYSSFSLSPWIWRWAG